MLWYYSRSKSSRYFEAYWLHCPSFCNRESLNFSSWEEMHISYLYPSSLPSSDRIKIFNTISIFRFTQFLEILYQRAFKQGIYFTIKKPCNGLMTGVFPGLLCTNIRSSWIDKKIEWLIEVSSICHLGNNTEKLRYYSTDCGKCLKLATNIWHYSSKARMHGSENQRVEVRMAHTTGGISLFLPSQPWAQCIWSTYSSRAQCFHQET